MKTGHPRNIGALRDAIKPGIKEKVDKATKSHTEKVEGEYDDEIATVKDANADSAEAQNLAAAEMRTIINRTKRSLSEARAYTSELFS